MPTVTDMRIRRMAINVIDLDAPNAQYSKELFPLGEGSEVIDSFFRTHYSDTRHGKYTKACHFFDKDATVKTKIERFAETDTNDAFLQLSKELTINLFKLMDDSSSTSSGTFFVFEVKVGDDEECIFLIKLDPKQGVQIDTTTLTVKVLENMLPDSNERVHKCAIIRYNKSENLEADLFVMDKQQKEGEPARFFINKFLQAEEILNDKIMTRHLIIEAKNKIAEAFPEVDINKIHQSIDREFSNGSHIEMNVAIKNIISDYVPIEQEDRELYINSMSKDFVENYLIKYPDHQTAFKIERKDNIIVFKSDKNQLYFRYNKGIKAKVDVNVDEKGDTLIKIDKALNFERI
ncbi:nucleoid-associated protein [Paraliobacillus sediminis]|uniref:nucleoid-associated protein n=1 Tax=Paraliobacillus sediminis TaxID=1885916 RepID=UPI000E3E4A53|nr:nucleoid-associated protein [Paraliobacillus sediminis]